MIPRRPWCIHHPEDNCFEGQYNNLFGGEETFQVNINSDEGDRILFDIMYLLKVCAKADTNVSFLVNISMSTYIFLLKVYVF